MDMRVFETVTSHSYSFSHYTAMKADRKRLKMEKAELVNQMQQLYATLESREEQLRDFIRNYEQHRKVTHTHTLLHNPHKMLRHWCDPVN